MGLQRVGHDWATCMPSNHLILCCPLLLPLIFLSFRVFSSESALCISRPGYWSFSISTSNEYSGLISFRIDWFDLLAIQGTLKCLLQHHCLKVSVLQCSAFSGPVLTSIHDYWENHSFDKPYLSAKWCLCLLLCCLGLSLLSFQRASVLISWLQSLSAVILESPKRKFVITSTFSSSICHEVMGPDAMIIVFGYWIVKQLFQSPLSPHQDPV